MSYLKLRELWNECEKLEPDAFNVFVEGLAEIHKKRSPSAYEDSAKPCVAKQTKFVRNCGEWEPQEDDLLHKCVTTSPNTRQGFVAFSASPENRKGRSVEAAKQRYFRLKSEGSW